MVSDERVEFRIDERLFVEARREGLELGEADVLDEAARRRVGRVRLTDDVQRHALRRRRRGDGRRPTTPVSLCSAAISGSIFMRSRALAVAAEACIFEWLVKCKTAARFALFLGSNVRMRDAVVLREDAVCVSSACSFGCRAQCRSRVFERDPRFHHARQKRPRRLRRAAKASQHKTPHTTKTTRAATLPGAAGLSHAASSQSQPLRKS